VLLRRGPSNSPAPIPGNAGGGVGQTLMLKKPPSLAPRRRWDPRPAPLANADPPPANADNSAFQLFAAPAPGTNPQACLPAPRPTGNFQKRLGPALSTGRPLVPWEANCDCRLTPARPAKNLSGPPNPDGIASSFFFSARKTCRPFFSRARPMRENFTAMPFPRVPPVTSDQLSKLGPRG